MYEENGRVTHYLPILDVLRLRRGEIIMNRTIDEIKAEIHALVDESTSEIELDNVRILLKLYHGDYKGDKKWQGKQEKAGGKSQTN